MGVADRGERRVIQSMMVMPEPHGRCMMKTSMSADTHRILMHSQSSWRMQRLDGSGLFEEWGWSRLLYSPHCSPGRKLAQSAPQCLLILWYILWLSRLDQWRTEVRVWVHERECLSSGPNLVTQGNCHQDCPNVLTRVYVCLLVKGRPRTLASDCLNVSDVVVSHSPKDDRLKP